MSNEIPNRVIGAVSSVLADHYYRHSALESLFMESGAPGTPPSGNCQTKCRVWLERCNQDSSCVPLEIVGQVIKEFMDLDPNSSGNNVGEGQARIRKSLVDSGLSYHANGSITLINTLPGVKSIEDMFKAGDFQSIEDDFSRTVLTIDSDPHAAITAASSVIESLCKTYIDVNDLEMPRKQTISQLWGVVRSDLGLNIDRELHEDQKKILQGLTSIIHGVGAFRTHIGSAHGRGFTPPPIDVSEARLAVNAAHTVVRFVMDRWSIAKHSFDPHR